MEQMLRPGAGPALKKPGQTGRRKRDRHVQIKEPDSTNPAVEKHGMLQCSDLLQNQI